MKNESSRFVRPASIGLFLFLFGMGVFLISMLSVPKVTAVDTAVVTLPNDYAGAEYGNCRYGAASFNQADNPFMSQLGIGWTLNFGGNVERVVPDTVEYVPMIRLAQAKNGQGVRLDDYIVRNYTLSDAPGGLGYVVTNNPGYLWLIGNEVDRVYWQDDIMPAVYAKAYHDLYHYIKLRDPSAEIAISGLVEVTPGRLQYLDLVWQSYLNRYGTPMPVDVWNMHVYILPEIKDNGEGSNAAVALGTNPALAKLESTITGGSGHYDCALNSVYCFAEHDSIPIFIEQVRAMRQWMKNHGLQQKPLILSEWSLLFPYEVDGPSCFLMDELGSCFTPNRVNNFMINSTNYLKTAVDPNLGYAADGNRLVQQWLWFAMNDQTSGDVNALINDPINPTALTQIGNTYNNLIGSENLYANLKLLNSYGLEIGNTTDAELTVRVLNNGNHRVDDYTVTFYRDAFLTNPIGSITVDDDVLNGCARETQKLSIVWPGLSNGVHYYWVKVENDLDNNSSDNVLQGFVIIGAEKTFLPVVKR